MAAPVNRLAIYPGVLTPKTQGQLRGTNSDTLYVNGWFDLSAGPVLIEVPEMGDRYYTRQDVADNCRSSSPITR